MTTQSAPFLTFDGAATPPVPGIGALACCWVRQCQMLGCPMYDVECICQTTQRPNVTSGRLVIWSCYKYIRHRTWDIPTSDIFGPSNRLTSAPIPSGRRGIAADLRFQLLGNRCK